MENYKKEFSDLISLDSLKEFCKTNISDIIGGNLLTIISSISVRFIDSFGKFGVTGLGRFFFVDDCMYLMTKEEKYKENHNPDICAFFGEEVEMYSLFNDCYIVRVIYAGIFTGFVDDKGIRIFTGDVVKATIFTNPHLPSKGGSQRARNSIYKTNGSKCEAGVNDFFDEFSLIFDNHRVPLSWANKLKVIGSLFFRLENGTTEVNIQSLCNEFAQSRPDDKENLLKLIEKSPYFPPTTWQEIALENLGVNDY